MIARRLLWAIFVCVALASQASAQDIVFASAPEARRILSTSDAYSQSMSAYDRSARMKTARETSEKEFLAFAARAALDWEADEREVIDAALREVLPAARLVGLPLPARIVMIKTSGAEDAQAAYTRQNAVVLPQRFLKMSGPALRRLVAHELFHVASRAHPKLADELYGVIGFRRCGPVELPDELKSRRITNPDAPKDEHCIQVSVGSEKVWALPILVSDASPEDFARGVVFLQRVSVMLLLVEWSGTGAAKPLLAGGAPRVLPVSGVSGFVEQIGENTAYVIHPEEIVADNFVLLATGERKVRSPAILDAVEKVIAKYAMRSSERGEPKERR